MTMDLGDRTEDSTLCFHWSTNAKDGAAITRSADGTVSVYKDDSDTQSVEGVTDEEDFDSLTGIHMCKIVLTNAFYAAGSDYSVILSAATIDGETVNAVLATFSIENRFMRGTDSAATEAKQDTIDGIVDAILVDTGTTIPGTITTIDGIVDDILVDTAEIGAAGVGLTAVVWNAAWDAEVQSECADALTAFAPPTKAEMDTAHGLLATPAQVNTEVSDVLKTDTMAEMAQGAPPTTPTFEEALMYWYMSLVQRADMNTTENPDERQFYSSDDTLIWKKLVTDDAAEYSEAKGISGA